MGVGVEWRFRRSKLEWTAFRASTIHHAARVEQKAFRASTIHHAARVEQKAWSRVVEPQGGVAAPQEAGSAG